MTHAGVDNLELHNHIRCRITDVLVPAVQAIEPLCVVQYDNAPFTPTNGCWLRATIRVVDSRRVVGGGARATYRHAGLLRFQVFAPIEQGETRNNKIIDIIRSVFKGAVQTGERYRAAVIQTRRRLDDEWMTLINIPFRADEIA